MAFRLLPLLCLALGLGAPLVRATSVVPPSFTELVGEADAIYRGRVTAVEARRVARADGEAGSLIKTFVTVTVDRVLKGPAQREVTLEFLGGTIGDEQLTVTGMPKFAVGDREIVFVQKNGVQFCPLVAFAHGRYRVQRNAASGADFVARDNGVPLLDPADVQLPLASLPATVQAARSATPEAALTPEAFEARIRAEVERIESRASRN